MADTLALRGPIGRALPPAWWLVPALFALRLFEPTTQAGYVLLGLYALTGREAAIRALFGSWFLTMATPALFAEGGGTAALRYFVVGAVAVSAVLPRPLEGWSHDAMRLRAATLLLAGLIVLHSLLFSQLPSLSLLKLALFTMVAVSLLTLWSQMGSERRAMMEAELFRHFGIIVLAGLPLMFANAGFAVNGTGFQGLLNHPQAAGLLFALMLVWGMVRLFRQQFDGGLTLAVTSAAAICAVSSESRTALFGACLALVCAIVLAVILRSRDLSLPYGAERRSILAALLLGGIATLFLLRPETHEALQSVVTKSGRAVVSDPLQAFEASRGMLIDMMRANIERHGWTGIGFGLPSSLYGLEILRDPLFGLPIGASVEKGVATYAIIEEMGYVLGALVFLWLGAWLMAAFRGGLIPLVLCLTIFFFNMGEYTLFSTGGMGLLFLILLTFSVAKERRA